LQNCFFEEKKKEKKKILKNEYRNTSERAFLV